MRAPKTKRKEIQTGIALWYIIHTWRGHTKINPIVKKYLKNWFSRNTQFVRYTIAYNCIDVYMGGQSEKHLVPKKLLQMSVRELYNRMASPPQEGGLTYVRDKENDIIIRNYVLHNILTPKLKTCQIVTRLCAGVSVAYLTNVCICPC